VGGDWPEEDDPAAPGARRRFPGRFQPDLVRPCVVNDITVRGSAAPDSTDPGSLTLNGLWIDGAVEVLDGNLGRLALSHITIVPPRGGLFVLADNDRLVLSISRVITGPLSLLARLTRLEMADTIVLGEAGSPGLAIDAGLTESHIDRTTVMGGTRVQVLHASDSLFVEPVQAVRRQEGCVRFSFVPRGSAAPARYRCQPDLEIAARIAKAREDAGASGAEPAADDLRAIRDDVHGWLVPHFESRRYGSPGFGQLAARCPAAIRTGAENGSEMGAFSFLQQPQRVANLRRALDEYLRFGLEAGVFFVTEPAESRRD
jgi:hypothetical protein